MIGSSSIDLSLANIWRCWFKFRKGKRRTQELETFTYFLEENLRRLHFDLAICGYRHGGYKKFTVTDNKRREISVARIRDRVVHRLLYEYLVAVYDKTFIYDAWSCRKDKGLVGAIERTQKFLYKHSDCFVWRADVRKFFDSVDHEILLKIISFRITDETTLNLLKEIISSYSAPTAQHERERERESKRASCARLLSPSAQADGGQGIPIGNLTSQIFANIYLNELDRFIKHSIKPRAYLRYGDDFIIILKSLEELKQIRERVIEFLREKLRLEINVKNDILIKPRQGLKFLGAQIFPGGRRLNKRNWSRAKIRINAKNFSSYSGLVKQHSEVKRIKEFNWIILEKLNL